MIDLRARAAMFVLGIMTGFTAAAVGMIRGCP
jgi:hypothetical protein